ncbi:MAG: MFS transporter [Oscillospiraceae bacterium]|jgi:MFS family permease|nr:MFS transporter [Oscillospiraceae bacterium]
MKKQSLAVKFAVLSLGFVGMANAFIAPAMATIGAAFPDVSRANIQLIMTFGMIGSFPLTLISGGLAGKFRVKPLVTLGAALIVAGALFPLALNGSIVYLYISSLLMGAGQGITLTLGSTLITQLFEEPERSRIFGINGSSQQAGSMIMMFAAGLFAAARWSNVYLTGLLCVPTLLLVIFCLPMDKKSQTAGPVSQEGAPVSKGWHPASWPVAIFILMFAITFAASMINSAMLLDEQLSQGSAVAGIVSSVSGFASILAGILYKTISEKLKQHILWAGALLLTAGLFFSYIAANVPVYFIGMCCINLGFTFGFVGGMHAMSRVVPPEKVAGAMGLFMGSQTLGSMICPYVINPIAELITGASTARGNYQVAVVWGVLTTVIAIIWGIKNGKHYQEASKAA